MKIDLIKEKSLESQILETFKTFQATAEEDPEYAENQIYKLHELFQQYFNISISNPGYSSKIFVDKDGAEHHLGLVPTPEQKDYDDKFDVFYNVLETEKRVIPADYFKNNKVNKS